MPAPLAATNANRSWPASPARSAEIARIGPLGKSVGAVVAAAKVLRVLNASERPLNASEVARAASLHRGTAYNILRTLQAESFVGYDEATRTTTAERLGCSTHPWMKDVAQVIPDIHCQAPIS